jgi:pheromone shutdown protein TraB
MDLEDEKLKTLTTVTTEFEATAIISALEAENIRAQAVGGYTAGFRAESPGGVSVIVAEQDLERAKSILAELRRHGAGVDWSQVDVDAPEDAE